MASLSSSSKSRRTGKPLKFNPAGRTAVCESTINFVPFGETGRSSPKKVRASSLNDLQDGLISAAFSQQQQQQQQQQKRHHQQQQFMINGGGKLKMATVGLLEVFEGCNGSFRFDRSLNPRRVLTKPAKPVHNGGYDNEKHDYILYVNDIIGAEEGKR